MNLYCLSNFVDYSLSIHQPLKHSNRIKYTCFDISENYIVFGATSGSLYLFNRNGRFLHLIPSKHGAVNHLSISPNEKYVGFSTQRSVVCVYTVNLSAQATPQVIFTKLCPSIHVTCLHWAQDEKLFYYGDSKGQVNLVLLSTLIGTSIINMSIHPILFLESSIVQIDGFESLLLVSNCSKCILCNTEYEEYKQIGNKSRDGAYGACFSISPNELQQPSRIFCARPGSRLWEVDLEGNVIQTHQFKLALACPPTKVQKYHENINENLSGDSDGNDEILDYQPQNLQFGRLQKLKDNFIMTYTALGLYIFDIRSSSVVLWCNQFERIIDCKVCNDEILVFTQTGALYSVQMHSMQSQASCLITKGKLLQCAWLMRKNVKYFAEKAREDYELGQLNQIKRFLMDRHQYEMLNDLSVIFDAISQCESNGDNSSGGSSSTADNSSNVEATGVQHRKETSPQGAYVLENSFCESFKFQKGEKSFKDALLTVTGKFGQKIIKYKFNIFAEEQQKFLRDLIPIKEIYLPFKDASDENDDVIVCRTKKTSPANSQSTLKRGASILKGISSQIITAEKKTIYNLYLICKSSKFSNTNFVERYRSLFDEYSAPELIQLLEKLSHLMMEHGDEPKQAQWYCFEMYFHYLNPELIWEMDGPSRDYISQGFVLLNSSEDIVRCDNCMFPLRFDNSCAFRELGAVLLRYYWSRNEQVKCFDMLTRVPALFDTLAKLYLSEYNMEKVLPIVLNYGQPELLIEIGKHFSVHCWSRCFQQFVDLQQGRLTCINCECVTTVENVNRHFFYTWNCFLSIILEQMQANDILSLILKWSNFIPHDAIDREFYSRCLLKA